MGVFYGYHHGFQVGYWKCTSTADTWSPSIADLGIYIGHFDLRIQLLRDLCRWRFQPLRA